MRIQCGRMQRTLLHIIMRIVGLVWTGLKFMTFQLRLSIPITLVKAVFLKSQIETLILQEHLPTYVQVRMPLMPITLRLSRQGTMWVCSLTVALYQESWEWDWSKVGRWVGRIQVMWLWLCVTYVGITFVHNCGQFFNLVDFPFIT